MGEVLCIAVVVAVVVGGILGIALGQYDRKADQGWAGMPRTYREQVEAEAAQAARKQAEAVREHQMVVEHYRALINELYDKSDQIIRHKDES